MGSQRGRRPSDVDMYSKDRGAYPATGCARAVTRRAGAAVRARTGAPRTAERVEAMDCIVRTRVCRRKCDTRRSKISLCPRGGALRFRRLPLGRDRGRDNFIFFQVGKGRGLIPPRPDVLLLVLRKYKAPGSRRLPPRHRNNRPPSLSSSPLRQIISSPALLDGGAQRILRELARGRDSLTGDVLPRLQDRREANFFARLDVPTLARRDPRRALSR